jgi:hypothetical protein
VNLEGLLLCSAWVEEGGYHSRILDSRGRVVMKGIGDAVMEMYSFPKRLLAPLVAIFVYLSELKIRSRRFSANQKNSRHCDTKVLTY